MLAVIRIGFMKMRDALMRLLEPPIEALHYELVDIEFAREGHGGVLRIFIDRPWDGRPAPGAASDPAVHEASDVPDPATSDAAEQATSAAPGHAGALGGVGITVDDCARVSHAVSEVLEIEDPIKGHYTLEVSSPGFDRILRKRAHFERFIGERIAAELKLPIDGRRRFVGVLKSIAGDSIVVEVDGQAHGLQLERIQKARLRPE